MQETLDALPLCPHSQAALPASLFVSANHRVLRCAAPAGMPQFTVGWWAPLYNVGAQLSLVRRR